MASVPSTCFIHCVESVRSDRRVCGWDLFVHVRIVLLPTLHSFLINLFTVA